jgi:hypothetical protein
MSVTFPDTVLTKSVHLGDDFKDYFTGLWQDCSTGEANTPPPPPPPPAMRELDSR